ncbi:ACT domain-containing protein [Naasia aerilata]|uniref:Aspartate kinase n=1 Tax=Naasia aerilata TaxID=1162966 RepID=A0ABM8G922_9MICO|nr:ACT domain-containing protein [Naasia aerilata]BDZ44689.1 hypothetical protein GCM10025866_05980 [Naasia aerilata]
MTGITDLAELLRSLEPVRRPDPYVLVSLPPVLAGPELRDLAEAAIREDEGVSLVLRRLDADDRGIAYDFVAAWVTLTVHSSLEAVGMAAAVSAALAQVGIPCNLLAGYHHDHLLVPIERADDAIEALRRLADA